MKTWRFMTSVLFCALAGSASMAFGMDVPLAPLPLTGLEAMAPTSSSDDQRGCLWVNQFFNSLFPDTQAKYSIAVLPIPPGGSVSIEGDFPHARYLSYNLYDERLAPLDSINDTALQADPGSINPFAPGADRMVLNRHYRLHIVAGVPPADATLRMPNTLYSFQTLGSQKLPFNVAVLFYRIYVPDNGTDITGNTGLPVIRFNDSAGQTITAPSACANLHQALNVFPNLARIPEPLSLLPVNTAAFPNPLWLKFFDMGTATGSRYYNSPIGPLLYQLEGQATSGNGGFASNADNRYLIAYISQRLGNVVAIHARFPDAPHTRDGRSPFSSGDLRYWSLCSNDSITLSVYGCVFDEQVTPDTNGRSIILVSKARDRPANARAECGVTWLDWGLDDLTLLIYRNLLPAPQAQFPYAVQYVPGPSGQHEAEVMRDYYPYASHMQRAAFESLGCPVPASSLPSIVTPAPGH